MSPSPESDLELVPVPLDRETRQLLVWLAATVGQQPAKLAAALLRDLLKDDAAAHEGAGTLN